MVIVVGAGILWRVNTSFPKVPTRNLNRFSIVGGVVPHHLVAEEIIEKFFLEIASSKNSPRSIILLAPDHFNVGRVAGKSFVSVDPDAKEFYGLNIDNRLLRKLTDESLLLDSSYVKVDHAVADLVPYIQKYFRQSDFVPILISSDASREAVEKLVKTINSRAGSRTIVIASVDFSHYLPSRAAEFHDVKSVAVLMDFRREDFADLDVDSWQALYGARFFARLRGQESPSVIGRGNSSDFLKSGDAEETTSYFSVVFGEKSDQKITEKGKTVLLVGDIMLDRGVESLMKKISWFYPFKKISRFLRGVDLVFGNLEGPIMRGPQSFLPGLLRFNFSSQAAEVLSSVNFNLLSLANNHALDGGEKGLKETREILAKEGVNYVGDPSSCAKESAFKKDDMIFLAFDKSLPPVCSDEEIISSVNLIKSLNPGSFLIVSLHWGGEYQLKNSISQQKLAHKIIEAGAEAIVGHHPHVVQNIEIYKSKPIFYSLGNFIFDQYFSENTQTGLAVGAEIYNDKIRYRLFPFRSRLSQPSLMAQKEAEKFLGGLASKSSPAFFDEIKNGSIELQRSKQPMSLRLTDESWREMLRNNSPLEPEWIKTFSE